HAFLHGVWPLVYRQMRLPVLAVLAFAASVVDMALILGPTRPATLSVRILGWLQSPNLDAWLVGSAGALAMMVLVVVLVAVWLAGERVAGAGLKVWRASGWRGRGDAPVRIVALGAALIGVAIVFAGFGGLILQSFAGYWPFPETLPQTMSASSWVARMPMASAVLADTLIVALGATVIALPLAVALLEAHRAGARVPLLIYAPLVVPQVAFLFGLGVLAVALGLMPGILAVTLCHVIFALPYALIALSGPWAALDPRYEAVAASVGAGPLRRFLQVRLPMLVRPLCIAAALSVAVSVGLYLPTQMIGGGRVETVTTEAVAAASAGDRRLIGMFATLQLLLPFVAFALARGGPALLGHRARVRTVVPRS
ncbi:MAG: ABC transporter permease, partial [Pseudomonadota bacterium]